MICESRHWKGDLLKVAKELDRKKKMCRWQERSFEKLEKDFFIAFFVIRKLYEARTKLSDTTMEMKINLRVYPPKSKSVTLHNWHKIDEHFCIEKGCSVNRKLLFICNQIIHSYIFTPIFNANHFLDGIFFSSDHQRNKALYFIKISEVIKVLKKCGTDYPNEVHAYYDDNIRDFIVKSKMVKR